MYLRDLLPLLGGLAYNVLLGSDVHTLWIIAVPYLVWGAGRAIAEVARGLERDNPSTTT